MKKCETCDTEIADNYRWCGYCVTKWKQQNPSSQTTTPKAWHDDPIVDILMKCNANLAGIKEEIKKLNEAMTKK